MRALRAWLSEPVSAASLVAFRILFGIAGVVAAIRFVAMGWVESLLVAPTHHLTYPGFEWVREPPRAVVYGLFALMGVASTAIALGAFYRVATITYFLAFTYVELIDQALYLNHYYAISLVAFLLATMPLGDVCSIDAKRRGASTPTLPRWPIVTLRAQLGIIYFFAGVAKLHPDWWSRAEPMRTWLLARTDMPVLGPLFEYEATAYLMSWAGLVFDLLVPFALLHRRTRPFAYAAVVVFHAVTGSMFHIGLFPLLMILFTPIFFEPDWPLRVRAWFRRRRGVPAPGEVGESSVDSGAAGSRVLLSVPGSVGLGLWFLIQIVLPLRHLAMPGDLLWTYEGFNYAWHVMIVEKAGHVDLLVVDHDSGRRFLADPTDYYTPLQIKMMSESPPLIVQYAHLVASDLRRRGHPHVSVYARAFASMNGRATQPLIDPDVDLLTIDEWTAASAYVVPLAPEGYTFPGFHSGAR